MIGYNAINRIRSLRLVTLTTDGPLFFSGGRTGTRQFPKLMHIAKTAENYLSVQEEPWGKNRLAIAHQNHA